VLPGAAGPVLAAAFTALFVFTSSAAADRFGQAISICSKFSNAPTERESAFKRAGWHKPTDLTLMIPTVADGLAVQNPPQKNTAAEWVGRRAWANSLASDLAQSEERTVFVAEDSIVSMKRQTGTGFPTCVIYSHYDRDTAELLNKLDSAGGLLDWDYSFRGEMFATEPNGGEAAWRTDVVIYGTRSERLPPLQPPLSATLAATLITKPVRGE